MALCDKPEKITFFYQQLTWEWLKMTNLYSEAGVQHSTLLLSKRGPYNPFSTASTVCRRVTLHWFGHPRSLASGNLMANFPALGINSTNTHEKKNIRKPEPFQEKKHSILLLPVLLVPTTTALSAGRVRGADLQFVFALLTSPSIAPLPYLHSTLRVSS